MRPDIKYIINKFCEFNKLFFDDSLIMPQLRLNTRMESMGMTVYDSRIGSYSNPKAYRIEISIRFDLPEEEYIDTIVHEMIHYYIWINGMHDDAPHGRIFMTLCEKIQNTYGVRVSVSFNPEEEFLINQISHIRYIFTAETVDGMSALAVVARGKIFELWDKFNNLPGLRNPIWYASNRAIFSNFPMTVTANYMSLDPGKLNYYLRGAVMLRRNGNRIEPVK